MPRMACVVCLLVPMILLGQMSCPALAVKQDKQMRMAAALSLVLFLIRVRPPK